MKSLAKHFFHICIIALCTMAPAVPAFAQTYHVNVMPNRQARPGNKVEVWGAAGTVAGAGHGNGTANGKAYAWTFVTNANVSVTLTGTATGTISSDRYIAATATFALLNGATRQVVKARLKVDNDAATEKEVSIDVISNTDAASDTPIEALRVDTNIAIEDGLRALLRQQNSSGGAQDGYWDSGTDAVRSCGVTSFAVWAFANSGHPPTKSTQTDIYSEFVQKGVNAILRTAVSAVPAAGNAGTIDLNGNNRMLSICGSPVGIDGGSHGSPPGYANGVAAAALMASYSATPLTTGGPIPADQAIPAQGQSWQVAGDTYRKVIGDIIDWIAYAEYDPNNSGRGGWFYNANGGGDTSVDSWNYVALEGFQSAYGGFASGAAATAGENIKKEIEKRVQSSQEYPSDGSSTSRGLTTGHFGYLAIEPCCGGDRDSTSPTTAGGLSGLVLLGENNRSPVAFNAAELTARKQAAVDFLGSRWDVGPGGSSGWGGHLGNFYSMWTSARALRLAGVNALRKGGVDFDWQSGETIVSGQGQGNVPSAGNVREGYFPYLVRTQVTSDSNNAANGYWAAPGFNGNYTAAMHTAWSVLILQPTVFGLVPVANDDTYGATEASALTVPAPGFMTNDLDASANTLAATQVIDGTHPNVQHGTLTFNTNGSFTFTPTAGYIGADAFYYKINNTIADSNIARVTINVAANNTPVAVADTYTTAEDTVLTVAAPGVLSNDSDPDSDSIIVVVGSTVQPTHGTVALNSNGSFIYTPAADYFGADSFVYTINDGRGKTATATAAINVTAVNDAPRAVNDTANVPVSTSLLIDVLANDTDPDGDTLTIVSATAPSHGTATAGATGITYVPTASYTGSDTFNYTIKDPSNLTSTATVNVTVGPTATIFLSQAAAKVGIGANQTLTVAATTSGGGPLVGGPITFRSVSGPNAGVLGTATTNATGTAVFTYTSATKGVDQIRAEFGISTSPAVQTTWKGLPVFSASDKKSVRRGVQTKFMVSASDPDGADTVAIAAPVLPPGASFDPASRILTWTAPANAETSTASAQFVATYPGINGASKTLSMTIGLATYVSDTGTDPNDADTDGDGFNDSAELLAGTDPLNPASHP